MISKKQILAEIQRMAEEGDGAPPGMRRFYSLTGIAEHEWRGKYWARWSEALEEAGYGANTWQEAFPDSVALDRLIQVIAELGRFPTQAEIKLARREDSSFPSPSRLPAAWAAGSFGEEGDRPMPGAGRTRQCSRDLFAPCQAQSSQRRRRSFIR